MHLLKGFSIKQQVFDRGIPTPLLLYNFLKMSTTLILSVSSNDDNVFNPWKESSDVKVGFIEVSAQNACNKVYCTLYFSCLHITFSPIFVKVTKDAVSPIFGFQSKHKQIRNLKSKCQHPFFVNLCLYVMGYTAGVNTIGLHLIWCVSVCIILCNK